jgi:hypothetical protein
MLSPHPSESGYYQNSKRGQKLAKMQRNGNDHTLLMGIKISTAIMINKREVNQVN